MVQVSHSRRIVGAAEKAVGVAAMNFAVVDADAAAMNFAAVMVVDGIDCNAAAAAAAAAAAVEADEDEAGKNFVGPTWAVWAVVVETMIDWY